VRISEAAKAILEEAAVEAVKRIRPQWPVKTGRSRAGFAPQGTSVINRVSYSGLVGGRQGGQPDAVTVAAPEHRRAVEAAAKKGAEAMGRSYLDAALKDVPR
jgi:hypothetical protein